MIIASRHIVNLECATVLVLNLAALLARTVFTNLLVPIPHIITLHLTAVTFEKDTTANPIRFTPTVASKMILPSKRSVMIPCNATIRLQLTLCYTRMGGRFPGGGN